MSIQDGLQGIVEQFVAAAGRPAVLDPGEAPLPLIADQWKLSEWNGRLVLQAWDSERNLVRKITGLKEQRRDRLNLFTERFPKARAEMQIADLAAPEGQELQRKSTRTAFRDRFQLMLTRQFPDWTVEEVSSEPNLEQSLSSCYARAFLRRGCSGMVAIGAPPDAPEAGGMVAFGLIWLAYVRSREKNCSVKPLLLFAPTGREREVSYRAARIDPDAADRRLFIYDERDRVGAVDFEDAGNVDSTLPPCRRPATPNSDPPVFADLEGADRIEQGDGSISLQVRGLEFGRWSAGKLTCGIGRRRRCSMETLLAMGREVARVRCEAAEDRQHPLYTQFPEGWLESQVRADPQAIDAYLMKAPIYGQVPIFGGADRGVIDLLAVEHTGRLVVIELKASADLQLPFQALDYWLRVRKHLAAGDFTRLGYFPGITIRQEPPRMLLVAPALEFHSTSESLIGCLSKEIEIARVGLAADWRKELRVMFRLAGSERPQ